MEKRPFIGKEQLELLLVDLSRIGASELADPLVHVSSRTA